MTRLDRTIVPAHVPMVLPLLEIYQDLEIIHGETPGPRRPGGSPGLRPCGPSPRNGTGIDPGAKPRIEPAGPWSSPSDRRGKEGPIPTRSPPAGALEPGEMPTPPIA